MKRILLGMLILGLYGLARAQTVQYGPTGFTATASSTLAVSPSYGAQVDTLGITVSGFTTTTSWTVQIQTSPDNTTWTNCGSAVTVTSNATVTSTCSPQGGSYVQLIVTAGTGGGSLRGSVFGLNTKIGSMGGGGSGNPDNVSIITSAGKLATNSIKVENTFASASTVNFVHSLSDEYPVFSCYSKSGAAVSTTNPVDANTMEVTSYGAADILCSFIATQPQKPDFGFSVTPNTLTYVPTMGGTQTPTFAIAQTAISGYSGTATYSTTGLASGMSSSYSPTTITGSGSSTLSLSFPATQAAATTTFNASATVGTNTHTQPVSLTINGINTNLTEGWKMNEGTGLTFNDAVSSNSMTATGITWGSVTGETGSFPQYTYAATSTTTYAIAANNTLTNFSGSTPFSVSFWMYPASAMNNQPATIVSSLNNAAGNYTGWEISTTGSGYNQIAFFLVNNYPSNALRVQQTTSQFSILTLSHVVVTYNGSETAAGVNMYVNGTAVATASSLNVLSSSTANSNPINVGQRIDHSSGFGGSISYLRIYSAALSSGQVSNIYAQGPR